MASHLELEPGDLSICAICQEKYTEPKCLPCLHSFCEACLSTYITSSFNENTSEEKGFLCPTCTSFIPPPKEELSIGKWAELFPSNHFILSLLKTEKALEKEKLCDWCVETGKENKAEHWCSNCAESLCSTCREFHLGRKFLKDHDIVRLDDIPRKGRILSLPEIHCPHHANKTVELYCKDHDAPCCVICMLLNHKHCTNVKPIDEASRGVCDSDDFNSLVQNFQSLHRTIEKGIAETRDNRAKLEESRSRIQNEITRIRCKINEHLDKIEGELRQEVTSAYETELDTVSAQEQAFRQRKCIVDNCARVMKVGKEKMSDVLNLIELANLKRKQKELSDFTQSERAKVKDVDFQLWIPSDISELQTSLTSFGKLVEAESLEAQAPITKVTSCDFRSATPELISTVAIKGCITGATFLPNQSTLIVDTISNTVALVDRDGVLISSLELSSDPWDVALITSNKAIVTLPEEKQLAFISIDDRSRCLTLSRPVNLTGQCRGICRLGDTLLVTYPQQLVTLDLCGNVMKIIELNVGLLRYVLAVDNDKILLADNTKHCVLCVDKDGNEKFRYSPDNLKYPNKITVDSLGNVYVAGWETNNIHQLTFEGKFVRLLPVAIQKPLCIEFEKNSNRFILSSECDKTISIFEMKE